MIRMIGMALLLCGPVQATELQFLTSTPFSTPAAEFGGFSSIHVYEGGEKFLATSDKGVFLSAEIKRSEGNISAVEQVRLTPIKDHDGVAVTKFDIDAEGLAVGGDGQIYVSFEAHHRVWAYASPQSPAKPLPDHPDFKTLQNNSALEALAIDANGWLYALPERSGEWERPFPVYRYRNGGWDREFSIPRRGKHLVVGADFGPDGWFYLLARNYEPFKGFSTRIRRFWQTASGFSSEQTLLETPIGRHDNLEGLSVWRDTDGQTRLTLISDDNFSFFQRTELVEYLLLDRAFNVLPNTPAGGIQPPQSCANAARISTASCAVSTN